MRIKTAKNANKICDKNEICENTDGSFICLCKTGYAREGKSCADINECDTGTHSCGKHQVCANTDGSYECACMAGYKGADCVDVDECLDGSHTCVVNESCINTIGSLTCVCATGFILENGECKDVSAIVPTPACPENAFFNGVSCTCSIGFYQSAIDACAPCPSGTMWDGYECAAAMTCGAGF